MWLHPSGLYYIPGANGNNPGGGVTQLNANAYRDLDVTPNWGREQAGQESFVLAVTNDGILERWSATFDVMDVVGVDKLAGLQVLDVQTCKGASNLTVVNAASDITSAHGLYFSTDPEVNPSSWVRGPGKMGKGYFSSLSFDSQCLLYVGVQGGYMTYNHTTSEIVPSDTRAGFSSIHVAGWDLYSSYIGAGPVKRVIAWPSGKPVIVGSSNGVYGANEPWSAVRKPYWAALTMGFMTSYNVSEMALDPVSGHVIVSTANAITRPKYCRRRRRGRRRSYRYYFCGFSYNYSGALHRTENSLLSSKTTGAGGIPFVLANGNGVKIDEGTGWTCGG